MMKLIVYGRAGPFGLLATEVLWLGGTVGCGVSRGKFGIVCIPVSGWINVRV